MEPNLVAVEIMEHLCTCTKHGYSQGNNRWGNDEIETLTIGGKDYLLLGGDRDCSSAVITAWSLALGISIPCTYTGNMREGFLATGLFDWYPMSSGFIAQAGDIYLNEVNHTAMCICDYPDLLGEFYINEHGLIIGGKEGDQTGNESRIVPYYDFPWDGILHYKGGDIEMTPSEFFNYEVPKANGGEFPVWQYFTWMLEYQTNMNYKLNDIEAKINLDKQVKEMIENIKVELNSNVTSVTKVKRINSILEKYKTVIDNL